MRHRAVVAVATRDPLVLGALAGHEVALGRRVVPHHIGLGSVWSSQRRAQGSPATMDLRRRANPDVELVVGRQGLVGRVHVCRGCATALVSLRHRVPPELTRLMTDAPGRGREPR
jgi:hypothetical protein